MWLFTPIGFFSIVRKPGDADLTIRSRTCGDLQRLIDIYLPDAGEPMTQKGSDYPWRIHCSSEDLARVMSRVVGEIEYDNFKDEVSLTLGASRAHRYGKVWQALHGMPDDAPEDAPSGWEGLPWPKKKAGSKPAAYGGVLVDPIGRVLLREVAGYFDGYVWTFAKGHAEPGETPRQTARREVFEETGVRARILRPLTPAFPGGTTVTHHFLMLADPEHVNLGFSSKETSSLRWANEQEARELIALTTNLPGRNRDLAVLDAAFNALPPAPLRRPIARREDGRFRPMPSRRAQLSYEREFTPAEMQQVVRGFIACCMEEKWCNVFQNNALHLHRSWAGIEVFRLLLEPVPERPDHWRVSKAFVNRQSEQYGSTDEAEDTRVLADVVEGMLHYGEAPGQDPMLTAFQAATQPNYLGSPEVVSKLVNDYFEVMLELIVSREATYQDLIRANQQVTDAMVDDPAYARMPWHSRGQLGEELIRRMSLDVDNCKDEPLSFVVTEALAGVSNAVRRVHDGFLADPNGQFPNELVLFSALRDFMVAVFLGTASLTCGEQTLDDFRWRSGGSETDQAE